MRSDPTSRYRFLADENFPGPSIRLLRALGYDVIAIAEQAARSADRGVLDMARREGRILLTFDRDHGWLIFDQKAAPPPGVLHFRLHLESPERPALRLIALLNDPEVTLLGHYTVIRRDDRISQRNLPTNQTAAH